MGGMSVSALAALLAVYLFWGGTYVGIKYAIETLPPFTMAGLRFLVAGLIVYIWQTLKGAEQPKPVHWRSAFVVGILMLMGGNGAVTWAEQTMPSGIVAIVIATVPIWMVLLAWLWQKGPRPDGRVFLGLLLGLAGIFLLARISAGESALSLQPTSSHWVGFAVLVGAAISWAFGSLYSRVAALPSAPLMAIGLQMLTGGACLLLLGLLSGEWAQLSFAKVSLRSALGFSYLVLFGSVIGFSAYIWLLKVANPNIVSTYAYVNPVVAVVLGWLLLGEEITPQSGLAASIILLGVIIIVRANRPKPLPVCTEKVST